MKIVALAAALLFAVGAAHAQHGSGLVTDFTTGNAPGIVMRGDFATRGGVLVAYTGNAAHVTIPANLGITEIGYAAFMCGGLVSVTIPNGVRTIGERAFMDCYELQSVTIPSSVTAIGHKAFFYTGLTSVTLPNSVTSIGSDAFYGCWQLTGVNIPASVISIGDSAFRYCSSLNNVTIPNSVIFIGDFAFYSEYGGPASIAVPGGLSLPYNIAYDGFSAAYNNNGRRAGTYLRSRFGAGSWSISTTAAAAPASMQMVLGTPQHGNINGTANQWYRVNLASGRYTFFTESSIDTVMWIYDASGREIAYDDDSGTGNNAMITLIVSAGTYYVRVRGYSDNQTGPYVFNIFDRAM